jgi:hypothetical protein
MIYKQKIGYGRHTDLRYGFMNATWWDAQTPKYI